MTKQPSYQDLQAQLQEVLDWFESPGIDIDQATKQYEKGQELIAKLETYLKKAEIRIEKIKKSTS